MKTKDSWSKINSNPVISRTIIFLLFSGPGSGSHKSCVQGQIPSCIFDSVSCFPLQNRVFTWILWLLNRRFRHFFATPWAGPPQRNHHAGGQAPYGQSGWNWQAYRQGRYAGKRALSGWCLSRGEVIRVTYGAGCSRSAGGRISVD